jgi:hypothetical protein
MNHPESIDQITAIERCLLISTEDAVEVLERASKDPFWPYREDLDVFEEIVLGHWRAIQAERARAAKGGGE